MSDAANKLTSDLALVVAGRPVGDVLQATADLLTAAIGFSAEDKEHALRACEQFGRDMRRNMEVHYDYFAAQRGNAANAPAGHA